MSSRSATYFLLKSLLSTIFKSCIFPPRLLCSAFLLWFRYCHWGFIQLPLSSFSFLQSENVGGLQIEVLEARRSNFWVLISDSAKPQRSVYKKGENLTFVHCWITAVKNEVGWNINTATCRDLRGLFAPVKLTWDWSGFLIWIITEVDGIIGQSGEASSISWLAPWHSWSCTDDTEDSSAKDVFKSGFLIGHSFPLSLVWCLLASVILSNDFTLVPRAVSGS